MNKSLFILLAFGVFCASGMDPFGVFEFFAGNILNLQTNATFVTIQSAVNAASDGDTLFLSAGVYSGAENFNVSLANISLTIEGEVVRSFLLIVL
jgi:predicted outer membrane repeat protein